MKIQRDDSSNHKNVRRGNKGGSSDSERHFHDNLIPEIPKSTTSNRERE